MSGTAKKRRRWPWMILALALLVIGGPIAWRLRPLNAAEARLVGTWKPILSATYYRFTPDRRFTVETAIREKTPVGTVVNSGEWSCRNDLLEMTPDDDTPQPALRLLARFGLWNRNRKDPPARITWVSNDRFSLPASTGLQGLMGDWIRWTPTDGNEGE